MTWEFFEVSGLTFSKQHKKVNIMSILPGRYDDVILNEMIPEIFYLIFFFIRHKFIYKMNELVRLVSLAGIEPQTLCLQSRSAIHYTIQESMQEKAFTFIIFLHQIGKKKEDSDKY